METTANNMDLTCREENGGIIIERVRTGETRAVVPEELFGLPVTALGRRAFAPHAGADAPDHRKIRAITLPRTLERVGDYAFYNCTGLERLQLTDRTETWGGSCLMNCRSLRQIEIEETAEGSTALFYFANELSVELDVTLTGPEGVELRLIFPEYIESYENNDTARHFDFHLYGPGFPYHNAFRDKRLDLGLFDGAWGEMLRREFEPACAMRLAFYRLRYPRGLSAKAEADYGRYLDGNRGAVMGWLIGEGDCRGLSWFLSRFRPGREELSAAADQARERRLPEATALLLSEQHRRFPAGRTKTFYL